MQFQRGEHYVIHVYLTKLNWLIDIRLFGLIHLRPGQHDDGYIDGRSQTEVHTDELTDPGLQRSVFHDGHPPKY